jgi:hypothetical protein
VLRDLRLSIRYQPAKQRRLEGEKMLLSTFVSVSLALLSGGAICATHEKGAEGAKKHRVELAVEFDELAGKTTPVMWNVDFDRLIQNGAPGLIDPHTLVVIRQLQGTWRSYPVRFSENLYYKNTGWIGWLVEDPQKGGTWFLDFAMRAPDGRMADPQYLPPVGVGDELCYNGCQWRPIDSPGYHPHPISADWNADGLIDILSRSHGANRFGMPMAGIFYWRNIGTNEEPRFGPPMRLYAEGVDEVQEIGAALNFEPRQDFISEDYIACDVFDWYGTGRLDLITLSRTGGIRVYRNTGRLDKAGLPILKLAQRPEYPSCLARGRYPCLRVTDWDDSGRPSLMIGTLWKGELEGHQQLLRQIVLMRAVGGEKGEWKFESAPLGLADGPKTFPLDWRKYSNFEGERAFYFDVHDVDGDGKAELFCSRRTDDVPAIELWRNIGTLEQPVVRYEGELPWFTHYNGFAFRFVRDQAFNGCLVGSTAAGAGMRYFEQVRPDILKLDAFRDQGVLLGQACELKLEGYVRAVPLDADGNGTMDLLCGDEPGFLTLVKNIGTSQRPAFAAPEKLKDLHGIELLLSDTNLFPLSRSKSYIGQVKPYLCDWDQDGELDIIVSGGTFDLIYWLDKYDPVTNRFNEMHTLRVKGANPERPFMIRKGPAVVDWDQDGRLELLAVSPSDAVCIFGQGKEGSPEGLTLLEPGVPLRYEDGEEMTTNDFLPYGNITLWPCDWTGSGACDLIVASNHFTWLVENVGSNVDPRFKTPEQFKGPDGTPIETSHHENHAAAYDWDADGRLDLMVGGESGTIYLFHRDWLSGITHKTTVGPTVSASGIRSIQFGQ